MAECINLKERFGDRYRITYDPAYDHKGVHEKDPWYMQIPCIRGTIYPYGGDRLAVEIDHHPGVAKQVATLPGVVCAQNGDNEKTYTFHSDMFEQVATIVQARKRRRLTEEQKKAAAERLANYKFRSTDENIEANTDPDDED